MKKIMSLAIIALVAVAMVSCCGQPKKKTGACGEPCCQPQIEECQQCPNKTECPKKAEEVKPACTAEKCLECPKKAECSKVEVKAESPKEECPNTAVKAELKKDCSKKLETRKIAK